MKPSFRRAPPGPTFREVLEGLTAELDAAGLESGRAEAERLLAHATAVTRSRLRLHGEARIDADQARHLGSLVRRRLSGVPLQHLEGTAEFRDLSLRADGRALIPRPETEQLVGLVAQWAFGRVPGARETRGVVRVPRPDSAGAPPCALALDIGTGSGAIALSLVHEGIASRAIGLDASADALEQASENRSLAGLDDRVELRLVRGHLWASLKDEEIFDLIVSNPPYVSDGEFRRLPGEVREHEPSVALLGGPDGLSVVREVVRGARARLRPGGALFLEIGEAQGEAVRHLARDAGPWTVVEVRKDLAERDRFLIALV